MAKTLYTLTYTREHSGGTIKGLEGKEVGIRIQNLYLNFDDIKRITVTREKER